MHSSTLGPLTQSKYSQTWWESARIPLDWLDGTPVKFSLHAKHESDVALVEPALLAFVSQPTDVRTALHVALVAYGSEVDRALGRHAVDRSKEPLAGVQFRSVQIQHHPDGSTYCLLSGGCPWDEEHGVQVVFAGGTRIVRVSDQDGEVRDRPLGGKDPFAV